MSSIGDNRVSQSTNGLSNVSQSSGWMVGNPSVTCPNGQQRVRCGLPVIRDEFVVTRVPRCTRRAHASGKLAGIELMVTGQPSRLPFCRECLRADCGTYFFKIVRQFSTTVKGTEALCVTGTPMRKRLPSAVTSPPIKPGGNWKRGLGAPASNAGFALMSTDISFSSEAT